MSHEAVGLGSTEVNQCGCKVTASFARRTHETADSGHSMGAGDVLGRV